MARQGASGAVLNLLRPHSSSGRYYASNNQFLKKGTEGFTEWKILDNDYMSLRLDFPGVSRENFRFSFDQQKKVVTSEGEAPQESLLEEGGGRTYLCNIFRLPCECCQYSGANVNVKDGVARIIFQKVRDKNFVGDGCANVRLSPVGNYILNMILGGRISTVSDGSSGDYLEPHPYVTKGSRDDFESKTTADGKLFVRVDMPGVAKKDAKVIVEGGEVKFSGKAKKREHDMSKREYMGSISLSPGKEFNGKVEYEMKDGVLRIVIPPA